MVAVAFLGAKTAERQIKCIMWYCIDSWFPHIFAIAEPVSVKRKYSIKRAWQPG